MDQSCASFSQFSATSLKPPSFLTQMLLTFFFLTSIFNVAAAEDTHFGCGRSCVEGSCQEVVQVQFLDDTLCKTDSDCGTDSYCGNEEGVNYCMNHPVTQSETPPQITDSVHINGTSATSLASSEPALSSTSGQGESSANSASSEPTISPTLATTVAPSSTVDSRPTHPPVTCRVLVLIDQSYSILHGGKDAAIENYKSSMDLVSQVFERDLGFGFDVEYIVDETNSIIGDNQSKNADYLPIRKLLDASTDPLLAGVGQYCAHVILTSRYLTSGSSGIGGLSKY
jgi:hypothetical protein